MVHQVKPNIPIHTWGSLNWIEHTGYMGVAFSRWFQQGTNPFTGTSDWIYTGGYFDRKYSDLPDIYWLAGKRASGLVYLWSLHHLVLIIYLLTKSLYFYFIFKLSECETWMNGLLNWVTKSLLPTLQPKLYTGNPKPVTPYDWINLIFWNVGNAVFFFFSM